MIVNSQKEIIFKNSCGCIVDFDLLAKAIVWFQDKPTSQNKKIYMHGNYPCVSIHKEKIHIHRLIMSYVVNKKLQSHEYVHHKNHIKIDARIENLEIVLSAEHQSYHTKNRIFSSIHKSKIGEANKKRVGIKYKKKVNIPIMELKDMLKNGKSIFYISKHFKCDRSTVKSRIYEHPHLLGGE